jgi:hypothetical protein
VGIPLAIFSAGGVVALRAGMAAPFVLAGVVGVLEPIQVGARYLGVVAYAWMGGNDMGVVVPTFWPMRRIATAIAIIGIVGWVWRFPSWRSRARGAVCAIVVGSLGWVLVPLGDYWGIALIELKKSDRWMQLHSMKTGPRRIEFSNAHRVDRASIGQWGGFGGFTRAFGCGPDSLGDVVCWNVEGREPMAGPFLREVRAQETAVGWNVVCQIDVARRVHCYDSWDEHGVPELPPAVSLAACGPRVCVETTGPVVVCWRDSQERLKSGGPAPDETWRLRIPDTTGGLRAMALGFDWGAICALTAAGTTLCWSNDQIWHHLGGPPIEVEELKNAVALSASFDNLCAIMPGGRVLCRDRRGRTIDPAPAVTDAIQIAMADDHGCIRTKSGRVHCWGDDDWGQTKTSDIADASWIAVTVGETCVVHEGVVDCRGRASRW